MIYAFKKKLDMIYTLKNTAGNDLHTQKLTILDMIYTLTNTPL